MEVQKVSLKDIKIDPLAKDLATSGRCSALPRLP